MTNKNTISVQLIVNDDGSVVMKQFGKNAEESLDKVETRSRKTKSALDSLSSGWVMLTAKAMLAYAVIEKTVQIFAKMTSIVSDAARYETLGIVMRTVGNNAGYTGEQMDTFAAALEKTGISVTKSRESLSRMIQAQLDLNKASDLARVAQDAAVIGNINSSEAFQRLVYGIQSAQTEMLRTVGINVNFENSYAKAAKTTGRAADSFSEAEKAAIRMNAVLDSGKTIAGTYEAAMSTAGKQLLSLERHFENLKVWAGAAFTPALAEIVETITGAVVDLNQELSGDSKEKIRDWGNQFRLTLISIEAEIYRLAMFIDKIGGTLTSAQMLLYGPGRALGFESSTKRFETAADANIAYEKRYKDNEKELEKLAKKYNDLEYSMSAAGKASAKAAADAAEKKRLSAATVTKSATDMAQADQKAAEKAKQLREEWEKTSIKLNQEIQLSGLTGLSKELLQNQFAAENLKKQFEKLNPATRDAAYAIIEKAKATADATARLNEEKEAEQDYLALFRDEAAERDKLIEYYSQIEGYEQKAHDLKLTRIEEERKAKILAEGDVAAANAKANQDQITALSDKIDAEQKGARSVIANYSSIIDAAMTCYSEESDEYKRLQDFKKVALAAELAMNISKNAQIIYGYFTQSAAAVAAAGVQNAANASTAVTGAVSSVAAQGTVPVAGFGLVAAMMAVMAGVLGIAGLTLGGGSSTAASVSSLPKSTVLGAEAGTGSESIANSLEILTDTYDMENVKLTKIYEEIKDLNNNITGLVTSIVRTGGISTEGMNLNLGGQGTQLDKITDNWNLINQDMGILTTIGNFLTAPLLGLRSLTDAIFGGSSETTLDAMGISIGKTTVNALMKGASVAAQQYATTTTTTDGGWFGSDSSSTSTSYKALDNSVTRMLTLVYKNISTTLITLSKELGTDTTAAMNYIFAETKLNLKDMTTDEMNKALQEHISNISDTAVEAIFGEAISQYQKLNEGLLETAVRLISDKETIAKILELTNQTFSGTTSQFIKFSESLITVAGSLDKLTDAFSTYYEAFTSDEKKQADRQAALQDALSSYGYSLPTNREGYSGLVETPGISQQAYYALLALSDTADKYYDYLEAAEKNAKSSIDPSDYATKVDYLRALAQASNGGNIPAFAAGTDYFGGGYAWVGESGRELAYFDSPARIYSNKDTVKMTSNNDLIAEIRALRVSAESDNIVVITKLDTANRYLQYLEKWDEDGLPAETIP